MIYCILYRKIEKIVGNIGDIRTESNAILLEYDLDVTPYSPDVIKGLPNSDYILTENDLRDREDWRQECIFTIDPDAAVDLDDSVSCKILENENYEVIMQLEQLRNYEEIMQFIFTYQLSISLFLCVCMCVHACLRVCTIYIFIYLFIHICIISFL